MWNRAMQTLDVIHSKVHPYILNGSKKFQGRVYVVFGIYFLIRRQFFDNIQVW